MPKQRRQNATISQSEAAQVQDNVEQQFQETPAAEAPEGKGGFSAKPQKIEAGQAAPAAAKGGNSRQAPRLGGKAHGTVGKNETARPVRYAVVGLGHIAQTAILPAFAHAKKNSRLVAVVSDDAVKRSEVAAKYGLRHTFDYRGYRDCVESGEIDAVYIATPNSEHRMFAEEAARAGVHVLCEKPMGVTERDAASIIAACKRGGVLLMTAYRLHFEAANLKAVEAARSGRLGELRIFSSVFTMQVRDPENIRLKARYGGGPLHDIGIYCINAARSLFGAEPMEVVARAANSGDARFREVDESVSCVMQFPGGAMATFSCSFGAADAGSFDLVGTRGRVRLDPAFEYEEGLTFSETIDGKTKTRKFAARDQFAAEIVSFSNCIRKRTKPEPSGEEGLADLRVIMAIRQSIQTGLPIRVRSTPGLEHPSPEQRLDRPPVRKRRGVRVHSPTGD